MGRGNHRPHHPQNGPALLQHRGDQFKNVRVPKENILAPPGRGFILAMQTFARTRPIIGSFGVGAARAAMEYALDYAKKRKAFGMALNNNQAIQFKLAEMYQKVETAPAAHLEVGVGIGSGPGRHHQRLHRQILCHRNRPGSGQRGPSNLRRFGYNQDVPH